MGSTTSANRSQPKPNVTVDYEGFDSREFNKGHLIYYNNWAITNTGGSTVTIRGFRTKRGLPILTAVKNLQLLNAAPIVSAYLLKPGQFEQIGKNKLKLPDLSPLSVEQLGSLNIAVPAGETKTVALLLYIDSSKIDANGFMLNLQMKFSDGYVHDLGKLIQVSSQGGPF